MCREERALDYADLMAATERTDELRRLAAEALPFAPVRIRELGGHRSTESAGGCVCAQSPHQMLCDVAQSLHARGFAKTQVAVGQLLKYCPRRASHAGGPVPTRLMRGAQRSATCRSRPCMQQCRSSRCSRPSSK